MTRLDPSGTARQQHAHAERGSGIQQAGGNIININLAPRAPDVVCGDGGISLAPPLGMLDHAVHGRAGTLIDLERAATASEGQVQVVAGMGGCGKTTVALEVARRCAGRMPVWWVSAATESTFSDGMRQVARHLGGSRDQVTMAWRSKTSAMELFATLLSGYTDTFLLVVDNADDPSILAGVDDAPTGASGWIRSAKCGAVLITSRDARRNRWGAWQVHALSPLSADHGAQVLLDLATADAGTADQARDLAERLGGLPLALRLAGNYLRSTAHAAPWAGMIRRFVDYQRALDEDLVGVLDLRPLGGVPVARNPKQVITQTWELSVDLLARQGLPQTRPLLRLLSCFADAPVPYFGLLDPGIMNDSGLFSGCSDETLPDLLHALGGVGLVDLHDPVDAGEAHASEWTVTMHPLVRDSNQAHPEVAGDPHGYPKLAVRLLAGLALASGGGDLEDPQSWPWWRAIIPHACSFRARYANHPDRTTVIDTCATANLAARSLHAQGDYQRAETEFQAVVDIERRVLGPEHPYTLTTRSQLAGVWRNQGDYQRAEVEFQAICDTARRVMGRNDPSTLTARHNLAVVRRDKGDYQRAEAEFKAVYHDERRVLGEEHPHTLTTRSQLAKVWRDQGDLVLAAAEFEAVFDRQCRVLGDDHPSTLATRHNLAQVWCDQGERQRAAVEFEAVSDARRRVLGPDHPDTLDTRTQLAKMWRDQGDLVLGAAEFEAVFDRQRRVLGDDHPSTLATRHDLARVWCDQGHFRRAAAEFRAVYGARSRLMGDEPRRRVPRLLTQYRNRPA